MGMYPAETVNFAIGDNFPFSGALTRLHLVIGWDSLGVKRRTRQQWSHAAYAPTLAGFSERGAEGCKLRLLP